MKATIRLVLITAFRDRLFSGIFGLLAVSTALSVFLGGTSLIEQAQAATVFTAGVGRLVLVLGLTIFAAFHIQGLFESREIEAILSRAISRPRFVVAYWLGLSIMAAISILVFAAVVAVTSIAPLTGVLVWAATVLGECLIILAVVLFAGLMLERATSTVLFALGFYALARLMGFFVGIRETATDLTWATKVIKHTLDVVLLFIPRLDLFGQSRWLVYGPEIPQLGFLAIQTVVFLGLVIAAAIFDLSRKEF